MNTLIYWCDKCGKRFARESSADAPGEAGSIFCTDCTIAKGTRLSTGRLRPGLRTSQTSVPPVHPSPERPPSERLRTPHHGSPYTRTEPVHEKRRTSPALLIGVIGAGVAVLVLILVFALRGPKPVETARKKDAPVTQPDPLRNQPILKTDAGVPTAGGGGESPVRGGAAPKPDTPISAADAESRAREAFDVLQAQLRQLPEGDTGGRLAACETFLQEHGSTILGARVRTTMADIKRLPAATPMPGVVNLAQGKPVKTSVGHETDHVPERAVDGNTDREAAWFGRSWPGWLAVDLGQTETIDCIDVFFYSDGTRYYQYLLEVSEDGQDYKLVADMSRNLDIARADGTRHVFSPVKARFVRVNILKNSANPSVHLAEVKAYARGTTAAQGTQTAQIPTGGKVLATVGVNDFQGGKFYSNFMRKGTDGRAIWGLRTDTHTMKGNLKLASVPTGALALEIRSLRNDPPTPPASIRVSINESVVYEGRDKNTSTQWQVSSYDMPQNLLKQGDNSLEIVCTEDSSVKNKAPWFMLNELKLLAVQPGPPVPDVHLSDLKPVKAVCGYRSVGIDKCCWEADTQLRLSGVPYAKGLGLHAASEVVYDLTPDYKRLVGRLGFHDRPGQRGKGSVSGRVVMDGKVMHETPVFRGGDPDVDFDVAIPPGSKQITLIVTLGGDGSGDDLVDWVNVGFMKK